ncbi:MAG: menaquinone biosynthesis decarboxylase [Candidatus Brocadiae bacterium]|nr:menaquinone biosynthesis decarboxylase [Candidatus Brocadiia bacterium]
MAFADLTAFIRALDQKGWLQRIQDPVSRDLEISAIADRAVKKTGPALLFENVRDHSVPVLINAVASRERVALALGVEDLSELTRKMEDLLALALKPPAPGFLNKLKILPKLFDIATIFPRTVSDAPCQEVVEDDPSFDAIPVLKCWPDDGGRYITWPLVFTRDPETGSRNCGIYRMQVYDPRTSGMHWHRHKDGARHFGKSDRLDVAVALGADPATAMCAAMPLPPDADEMVLAGFLRGEAVRMVKCRTIDVEVPANAEIVLEGYVQRGELRREGPFGDHTGFYSLADDYPVFHLQCVTRRKRPTYLTTIVGVPPMEDCFMGAAIERLFLPLVKMNLPEVVDLHMPWEGVFHNLVIVSIRKRYPGHARKVMHALWGMGQMMFTKVILVVDAEVNPQDYPQVALYALNHIDPSRDFEHAKGPMDVLDHASLLCGYGGKVGIDATRKWKDEGFDREWPDPIVMDAATQATVDGICRRLGL